MKFKCMTSGSGERIKYLLNGISAERCLILRVLSIDVPRRMMYNYMMEAAILFDSDVRIQIYHPSESFKFYGGRRFNLRDAERNE
jgi:hypothetical protein